MAFLRNGCNSSPYFAIPKLLPRDTLTKSTTLGRGRWAPPHSHAKSTHLYGERKGRENPFLKSHHITMQGS